jgi:hypothetical protein
MRRAIARMWSWQEALRGSGQDRLLRSAEKKGRLRGNLSRRG